MTGAGRDPFASYRSALDAVGFRPSSALGQNFLLDPTLHRLIADTAAPTPKDTVLEIGVGLGFLTRELVGRAGAVVGVEIDPRLLAVVRPELQPHPNLQLLQADALGGRGGTLHVDLLAALAAAPGELLVVANLPYAVSGPLLAELCALDRLPLRIVVLVQKELAARLAAAPGGRDYGGLSAQLQALYAVRLVRSVPPQVFRPRPKVTSAIVRCERRQPLPEALQAAPARRRFAAFLRLLFQQRRKTLRAALAHAAKGLGLAPPGLPAAGLERRAEMLGPAELLDLWQRLERG